MTLEYASPEQIRGESITTASDVYSLGVVLYQLLTGHYPYRLNTHAPMEIEHAVCSEDPVRPSAAIERVEEELSAEDSGPRMLTPEAVSETREGRPEKLRKRLRGDLDTIALMAMRKEPQRRYSSAEQLSEDIRRHLEGLPVMARKDTLSYRVSKFVSRHRVGVAAAGLMMAMLIAGVVGILNEANIARSQGVRAERRFNDVRRLANSLLFELEPRIENLPGSTPARELLVKRASEYLDNLAREASDDRALLSELASSYTQLGDIQWNRYYAHLGDPSGALVSERKALAIREALVSAEPNGRSGPQRFGRQSD